MDFDEKSYRKLYNVFALLAVVVAGNVASLQQIHHSKSKLVELRFRWLCGWIFSNTEN